jgi:hypothetical protein
MSPKTTKTILGYKESYKDLIKDEKILEEIWFNNIFIAEVSVEENENVNSHVGYASIITSKARIKLWKNLNEVIKNEGRLLYCDTDSIFAAFNKEKRVLNTKMGDIFWDEKNENTLVDDAVFIGTRTYSLKRKEKW